MRKLPSNPRVAVIGATGAVGRVMLDILAERGFAAAEMRAIATARSAGRQVPYGEESLTVETVEDRGLDDVDLVLLDTPDGAAAEIAPAARDAGAIVVDNSGAWRMDPGVPLVVPEINARDLEKHEGIISSPNCTTITMALPLAALDLAFGLRSVIASSYQSASGAGQPGVEELREQAGKLATEIDALQSGRVPAVFPEPSVFAAPIAFNVIPQVGSIRNQGFTGEEWKMLYETRKILGIPDLPVTATCVRVPSVAGHGVSVNASFNSEIEIDDAVAALSAFPGLEVVDLPTPQMSAGSDSCFVGRIRRDPHDPRSVAFFSTCDNLRKGAALNSVQIAESLR